MRTAAVYSKHDVRVKAVEMGHVSILQRPYTDLLNTCGEDSVTSGPCVWLRRPRANTQIYPQNIETDVRAPEDTNPADEEYLGEFTKRLCNLKSTPVILPLFKQLHGTPEEDTITEEPCQSSHHRPKTGKLNAKRLEILRNDPRTSTEEIVQLLSSSDTERKQVERTTVLKAMAM